jgi:hypothetical protein
MAETVTQCVPTDATVIVPPDFGDFRLRTLRSSFVTVEDMVPTEFSRRFAAEWASRARSVKAIKSQDYWVVDDVSLPLTEGEVISLAKKYEDINLEYIVTARRYNFPLMGGDGIYVLYKIPRHA